MKKAVDLGQAPLPKSGRGRKRLVIEVEVGDELTISGRRYVVAKRLAPFKYLIAPHVADGGGEVVSRAGGSHG